MAKVQDLPKNEKTKGEGHRKRLRTRFMEAGLDVGIQHLQGAIGITPRDLKA